jgi:hypothetical protein
MLRYLAAWFPMIVIAVLNGIARQHWLLPHLGDHRARQLSTLILIALFGLYIGAVTKLWPLESGRQAALVGAMWLLLTLAFEFLLGRFISGLSWQPMLAEYNLASGNLWALVPLWVAIAPYFFYRLWLRSLSN